MHTLESLCLLCTLKAHTQVSTLLAVMDHHVSKIDKVNAACDIRGQTLEQIPHLLTYPCNGLVFTGEVDHNNQWFPGDPGFDSKVRLGFWQLPWGRCSSCGKPVPILLATRYVKIRHAFSDSLWIYLWSIILAIQGFMSWFFVDHSRVILQVNGTFGGELVPMISY